MTIFDNSFQRLPPFLFESVKPTPISNARLIHVSKVFRDIALDMSHTELLKWLNSEMSLKGEQRIATRYAGHQFGVWAGQLGDGRAISLGEILNKNGRFEIQTKGSGITPFSRMGDGKAVIRSSVREYLCSEAMSGLNIPTTRALALLIGEDSVYREEIEKSAIVARVFPSNLRFGHFELCFHFKKEAELKALVEYTRNFFFDGLSIEEMLREVVIRTAKLLAHWQSIGFCHGVMNTDNMSILGLTIDYGPFGFLEDTILNHICNHSDHQGRYSYNNQPSVAMWNLEKLFVCFINFLPHKKLEQILNSFPEIFESEYIRLSRIKMGFETQQPEDYKLFVDALQMLSKLSIDFTFFWRQLSDNLKGVYQYYGDRPELIDWHTKYKMRLKSENVENIKERMLKANPKYVLRNYIAQEVIEDVEKGNDKKLKEWLNVFYSPFDEHHEFENFSFPTPSEHKNYQVSCSS
jgi:uncharacterized protein YdiU (UPF0061 family)